MPVWLTYTIERFPPPVYLLVVGGFVLSGAAAAGAALAPIPIAWAGVGLLAFFFELRLMDELKDFEKDKIANPGRPLPRGLLSPELVRRAIGGIAAAMAVLGVVLVGAVTPSAGVLYLLLTAYLWLMYREFYIGTWLSDRPILYAITHQVILLPMVAFAACCFVPEAWRLAPVWYMGMVSLGGFFAYEVCRKLDPLAHPVLKTYLSVYGPRGTVLLVFCALVVAAIGAGLMGARAGIVLWPVEGLLAASLAILLACPNRYKIVEGVASISLLAHLWGGAICAWMGWKP